MVVALAEAAYTRSQLPESTSGRPNVLLVALGAAAVTAVCPCPTCLLASNSALANKRACMSFASSPFEPLQLSRRCAGQKQTRQKSAVSTHSQAMLCSGIYLLLQGCRAPCRWTWIRGGPRGASAQLPHTVGALTQQRLAAAWVQGVVLVNQGQQGVGLVLGTGASGLLLAQAVQRTIAVRARPVTGCVLGSSAGFARSLQGGLRGLWPPCSWGRPVCHQICEDSRAALGHAT